MDNVKMKTRFVALLMAISAFASAQKVYVIHAPHTISPKEFIRLRTLTQEFVFGNDETVETPEGDVLINLKNAGVFLVSHESELLGPIVLLRELFALSNKYEPGTLIPFSELSPVALKAFESGLWSQFPQYDVGPNSAFSINTQFGKEVRSGNFVYSSYANPSIFGGGSDRKENQATYSKLLASKPLIVVRKPDEVDPFTLANIITKEGVFYDPTALLRPKLELDRRGLEIYEAWSQQMLQQIDERIAAKFSDNPSWSTYKPMRNLKTMEELRRDYPDQFEAMASLVRLNYRQFGLKSETDAEDLVMKASFKFCFRVTISANLGGTPKNYTFGTRG